MIRRVPRSTLPDTLYPYTTLFRSGGVVAGGAGADDDDVELFAHFIRSQRNLGFGIRDWEGGVSAFAESPIPNPQSRDAARGYIPSSIRCGFSSWFLMSTRNSTASLTSMMR